MDAHEMKVRKSRVVGRGGFRVTDLPDDDFARHCLELAP